MLLCGRRELLKRSIVLCLVLLTVGGNIILLASDPISYNTPLGANDVRVGPHYIEMPLGKIFLIRKSQFYGAVKLTKFWMGRTKRHQYATYECWYQDDGTGDFSNKNVKFKAGKASSTLYGIGRFSFNFGNEEIRCGSFRLWWLGNGMVYFFKRGQEFLDYGIELAPTKWTDIREVDVFYPHLKWYKYNKDRPRTDIPVDKLW